MKLAVMQPYWFPYVGYFQLVAAVDKFVFFDDVNYKKRGWINRNRFLLGGERRYITVPLSDASQFKKINEIVIKKSETWGRKISKSLRQSYSKAPYFDVVNKMFSEIAFSNEDRISEMAAQSVMAVSRYLGLKAEFVLSSACYNNADLNGVERIMDICRRERADQYFNLPSGMALYDKEIFKSNGVGLHFIKPSQHTYRQFSKEFHPWLSIIDVLMFNGGDAVREMFESDDCRNAVTENSISGVKSC